MQNRQSREAEALQKRVNTRQHRSLRLGFRQSGRKLFLPNESRHCVDFSSNDYLGLASHPKLLERAGEYGKGYGVGARASRLVNGNLECHEEVEAKLAHFFGSESAILFPSGYQANIALLSILLGRNDPAFIDRHAHNSLVNGVLLSRAKKYRFLHNDLNDLKKQWQENQPSDGQRAVVVTESLFSMDGDCPSLNDLRSITDSINATLYIDEAHAVGVFGEKGVGIIEDIHPNEIKIVTFGKAWGCAGAAVLCSGLMKDYLVNFCAGFIYSTAVSPMIVGAIDAALELMPLLGEQRSRIFSHATNVREALRSEGYSVIEGDSYIVPVLLGDEESTLKLSAHLLQCGILAVAIRPPTVPENSSRIRLSLSSQHSEDEVKQLIDAFRSWDGKRD